LTGVYLHSIGSALGDARPISSIAPIAGDSDLLDFLHANGLRDYRHADRDPPELAAEAMRETLRLSGLDPRQIGAVVWSSTSFQQRSWYTDDVSRQLGALGLWTAIPVGVTLSECGNLAAALQVATGLVADGHRHVLVVVADRCPSPDQRLVAPSLAVLSDGAASCIVSAEPGGFEFLAAAQYANHRARPGETAQSMLVIRQNAEGMRRAVAAALGKTSIAPDDVGTMLTNNLAISILELFATQAGIPFERMFTGNISSHGHVYAADVLLNLAGCSAKKGSSVLLATNGTCNWAAIVLRRSA
jgi:3-oxoacyl-[acyl-carrier-protein] synthase III